MWQRNAYPALGVLWRRPNPAWDGKIQDEGFLEEIIIKLYIVIAGNWCYELNCASSDTQKLKSSLSILQNVTVFGKSLKRQLS